MIARWMLAAIAFALCTGIVALAAERGLRAMRKPTRWVWTVGLAVGLVWPAISALRPVPAPPVNVVQEPVVPMAAETSPTGVASELDNSAVTSRQLDGALLLLWVGASSVLLLRVLLGVRALDRARTRSRRATMSGERVLVAESLGPAVLGVREPRIVVPEWLLSLDTSLQSLVIRHEREHCEARDTALVWLGVTATVLMPWNASVWWMSRRLRLAMEIDCDARTLRGEAEHTTYAKLLLLIAQRQTAARFVPMLAESSSHLSRRIAAMRANPVKHRVVKALLLVAVASVAVVVACSPRLAGNLTGPAPVAKPAASAEPADAATLPAESAAAASGDKPYFDFQVQKPATLRPGTNGSPGYPAQARAAGMQGSVLAQFVVNTGGAVEQRTIKVLKSDNELFSGAVRDALPSMQFVPARDKGVNVRQLVQMPFTFSMFGGRASVLFSEGALSNAMMPKVAPVRAEPAMSMQEVERRRGAIIADMSRRVDSLEQSGSISSADATLRRKAVQNLDSALLGPRATSRFTSVRWPAASNTPARVPAPNDGTKPYFDFQVDKPVTMAVGTTGPKYPDLLRSAGIEGTVLAQFVVNTDGRAEMATFKVLRSDNQLFETAVRESVAAMQFTRAELNGTVVRQLVQQPFQFSLSR